MWSRTIDFPYERQDGPTLCAAASLAMVYRSYGIECAQEELWPRVSSIDRNDTRVGRTRLICKDALDSGFAAVILAVIDPWKTVRRCLQADVRVVLRHRYVLDSSGWHYSVAVGMDDDAVIVHDPKFGPERRLSSKELGSLSCPKQKGLAGSGLGTREPMNILVAIDRADVDPTPCPKCAAVAAEAIVCPRCREPFRLRPAIALGCAADAGVLDWFGQRCDGRDWRMIHCPHCDAPVSYVSGLTKPTEPKENEGSEKK